MARAASTSSESASEAPESRSPAFYTPGGPLWQVAQPVSASFSASRPWLVTHAGKLQQPEHRPFIWLSERVSHGLAEHVASPLDAADLPALISGVLRLLLVNGGAIAASVPPSPGGRARPAPDEPATAPANRILLVSSGLVHRSTLDDIIFVLVPNTEQGSEFVLKFEQRAAVADGTSLLAKYGVPPPHASAMPPRPAAFFARVLRATAAALAASAAAPASTAAPAGTTAAMDPVALDLSPPRPAAVDAALVCAVRGWLAAAGVRLSPEQDASLPLLLRLALWEAGTGPAAAPLPYWDEEANVFALLLPVFAANAATADFPHAALGNRAPLFAVVLRPAAPCGRLAAVGAVPIDATTRQRLAVLCRALPRWAGGDPARGYATRAFAKHLAAHPALQPPQEASGQATAAAAAVSAVAPDGRPQPLATRLHSDRSLGSGAAASTPSSGGGLTGGRLRSAASVTSAEAPASPGTGAGSVGQRSQTSGRSRRSRGGRSRGRKASGGGGAGAEDARLRARPAADAQSVGSGGSATARRGVDARQQGVGQSSQHGLTQVQAQARARAHAEAAQAQAQAQARAQAGAHHQQYQQQIYMQQQLQVQMQQLLYQRHDPADAFRMGPPPPALQTPATGARTSPRAPAVTDRAPPGLGGAAAGPALRGGGLPGTRTWQAAVGRAGSGGRLSAAAPAFPMPWSTHMRAPTSLGSPQLAPTYDTSRSVASLRNSGPFGDARSDGRAPTDPAPHGGASWGGPVGAEGMPGFSGWDWDGRGLADAAGADGGCLDNGLAPLDDGTRSQGGTGSGGEHAGTGQRAPSTVASEAALATEEHFYRTTPHDEAEETGSLLQPPQLWDPVLGGAGAGAEGRPVLSARSGGGWGALDDGAAPRAVKPREGDDASTGFSHALRLTTPPDTWQALTVGADSATVFSLPSPSYSQRGKGHALREGVGTGPFEDLARDATEDGNDRGSAPETARSDGAHAIPGRHTYASAARA